MAVPGSNLLTSALSLICRTSFQYVKFQGITTNAIGLDERTYADPVTISGSVQDVDVSDFSELGLDFSKSHIQVWTETNVDSENRETSGDQILFNNRRFEVMGETDWHPVDGWNHFIAVEVPTP